MDPSLSSDPRDKLLAALNWPYGQWKRNVEYAKAPLYFDGCYEWHQALSDDDLETVLTLADVMASAHKETAEGMAASLPPAPRCPL